MIQARVRCGATWSDACILNVSSRGMLIHATQAPSRGTYLEIRRGTQAFAARVVWTSDARFGVLTQDSVSAEQLINGQAQAQQTAMHVERRRQPRTLPSRHEASRFRSRAMEFAAFALFGAIGATFATSVVNELLGKPLEAIRSALRS